MYSILYIIGQNHTTKILKMNKNVFLYRNQQIPFGFFSSANLNKMTKLKRLFTFKLTKQNNHYNDLITVACLMFSVFCSVSVFGQTAPDAVLKSKTNVKCFGGNDGSIEVKVLSGSPIYRYSIFGGSPYQYSSKFVNSCNESFSIITGKQQIYRNLSFTVMGNFLYLPNHDKFIEICRLV